MGWKMRNISSLSAAVFLCLLGVTSASELSCEEVKKVFELRQIGPSKWLPGTPRAGSGLQVCTLKNKTCCTRKMEDRYQSAAHQDLQRLLRTTSSALKFLISQNAAAFQEAFQNIIQQAEDNTKALLRTAYRKLAPQMAALVQELFADVAFFIFGSEKNVDEFVNRFFDNLFPLVYTHLIKPGLSNVSPDFTTCIRRVRKDLNPFGYFPKSISSQMSNSLTAEHMFLQALNLGIEIINTTDHLHYTKECSRALLKMQYCSHCQGWTNHKPCMGYCLNVIRGCLANMAEIDSHWREYIRSLEELSSGILETYDLEQILLNLHSLVNDAIMNAQINGSKLSAMVNRACGHPVRKPAQSRDHQPDPYDKHRLKFNHKENEESLSSRRKEFISSLRLYRPLYGGLADQLCLNDLATSDGLTCWNGEDVVSSYTRQVVGNGIKAQSDNPEVKVKAIDPMINQVIDKLKHINQLLQGKVTSKYEQWRRAGKGSGQMDSDDVEFSGDCDDEDGCIGSGNGAVRTVFKPSEPGLPEKKSRHRFGLSDADTTSWTSKPGGEGAMLSHGIITVPLITSYRLQVDRYPAISYSHSR
ncbi:glypican-5-like isoform X4 [Hypanus sabinus]|uniref:glypican-5-like isoform X4 n=1 Tax=Hypanus sabinus TaxID=79690 RepID=UPI0028C40CED|nr:glypican-5-like isoform X4 [Hypanus sabinus]